MRQETADNGGRVCVLEIPPSTVNFDHISDEEKLELWAVHRGSPAGIRQRLIDFQGVGL
ncbi:hypothetical protein N836_31730 [Leptolyngbya sp. Heron Island J]|uniref:hypothetical protein n=1 Tax=Leptolyngbya sp. Heron Island J TaxID=1385935 RepID=UPI0003B9CFE8|nr:hypothetical protein [Leptolyngbya sp. Heron Island J]ESA38513.1 hypothetical protein N836_31730 [Leptolyngbya sp. Heron Island J]